MSSSNRPSYGPIASGAERAASHARSRLRSGVLGAWVNLTAPPRAHPALPLAVHERLRKAELTSVSILAVAAASVALLYNGLADAVTGKTLLLLAIVLVIAVLLNRQGADSPWRTTVAAYLAPSFMMLTVMFAVLQAGGGLRLFWFPAYDLLALPIIIVGLSGHRHATWIFGALSIGFVVATYVLMPHAAISGAGAQGFDDIAYEAQLYGVWGMLDRHIALIFFASLLGWLGASSVEDAIKRADRAEELAALEGHIAAQKQQLEDGMQQILQTLIRAANADLSARAPLAEDHMLWQIAQSVNTLLSRLQRASGSDNLLIRTTSQLQQLTRALDEASAGRQPNWPQPSGTLADAVIERVLRLMRSGVPRSPMPPYTTASPYRTGAPSPAPGYAIPKATDLPRMGYPTGEGTSAQR